MKLTAFNYKYVTNQSNDALEVYIDGDIVDAETQDFYKNWFGDETSVSFKSFRNTILAATQKRINININSGGGMCADALAMHDFIKEQIANGRDIHTYGKGIVASAATYPLLAAGEDRMHISENCFVMIHNVSGTLRGDVNECQAGLNMMRKFNDCARDLYASYFNQTPETIAAWMNAETWWRGTEMQNLGLIKSTGPAENVITNTISKKHWPFQNTAILNTINNSIPTDMKKNKLANAITAAFAALGLTNDAKLSTVKVDDLRNALTTALEAQADDDDTDGVTNAVTAALSGEAFTNAVATAVNNLLATIPANITTAITTATNGLAKADDVVTKTELEALKNDLAQKIGNPLKPGNKGKKAENSESEFEHEGIGWGGDEE